MTLAESQIGILLFVFTDYTKFWFTFSIISVNYVWHNLFIPRHVIRHNAKKLHSNNHCVLPKPQLFHFRSCFLINLDVKTPKS